MSNEAIAATLFWLAGNMHVWVPPLVMALAGLVIGILHLLARLTRDGSG